MRFHLAVAVVALILVLSPVAAARSSDLAPDASSIEHTPMTCVVAGTYPWIEARAPETVSAAWVRLRPADSEAWYGVRLALQDGRWAGSLPSPEARLGSFVYYVEVTHDAARSERTADQIVRVVSDASACGAEQVGPSVADALPLVEAPAAGAPVPPGFGEQKVEDDAHVEGVMKVGVFGMGPVASVLAGVGVTAAAVALGVDRAGSSENLSTSRINFLGSDPGVGSQISLAAFHLSLWFRAVSDETLGPGSVAVSLRPSTQVASPGNPTSCIDMWVPHGGLASGLATDITVARVLFVTCEPPFSVSGAVVTVRGPGETDRFSQGFPMEFEFVP